MIFHMLVVELGVHLEWLIQRKIRKIKATYKDLLLAQQKKIQSLMALHV